MSYDVEKIRKDFPILSTRVGEYPLTYLDSANTSQKPQVVIDALSEHYARHNANVARAMHQLGLESTQAYEGGRERTARFLGASRPEEVVALSNASEALNLCAHTLGERLGPGDEVVISVMEHHSNLVPWQLVCQRTGATLRWFDITDEGRLDLEKAEAEGLINEYTKVVSLTLASNVLGTINPIGMIAEQAHAVGAVMVVDASQAVPQMPVDVSALGADLVAFTGHKMCGPTGIGILWGRYDLLAELPPFLGGGEMIEVVRMGDRPTPSPRIASRQAPRRSLSSPPSAWPLTIWMASGWRPLPSTSTSSRPGCSRVCRPSRGCTSSDRSTPPPVPARCPSPSREYIRTTP